MLTRLIEQSKMRAKGGTHLVIGQMLGHYRIIEEIGSGGMGVVYRAHDEQLDREVAIKVLPGAMLENAKAQAQLRNEARIAATLNHPHICVIYEIGESDRLVYIAMEYVDGTTLKAFSAEGLSTEVCLRYAVQISEALAFAHAHGILHRDIKSSNVLISSDGRAKVLDFGLAKRLVQEDLQITRSAVSVGDHGGIAGSLHYMCPEILQGKFPDCRSDVWSFGVMLYEMATGELPFKGHTAYEVSSEILRGSPKPLPPGVHPAIAAVVQRCLSKEPAQRYQQAGELKAALEAIQIGQHASSTGSPFGTQSTRRYKLIAIAISILVTVAVVFLLLRHRFDRVPEVSRQGQLVVLPLQSTEADAATTAFGRGLVETLTAKLTQLSQSHRIQVVASSAVQASNVSTLEQARQEFGVNLGLELDLHRSGDQIRINYNLIDANSMRQLEAGTVTGSASRTFDLEDKVAEGVVNALEIQLKPEEERVFSAHGTVQPAAYDYYLQGRGYLQSFNRPENIESAISVFNRALELDPNYGLAFAGLGQAYWREFVVTKDRNWIERARNACDRSIALQSQQADGHICLGTVLDGTGQYEDALEQFQRAIDLAPIADDSYIGLASTYESLGRSNDAEDTYRRAISLRPSYPLGYNRLGQLEMMHAQYEEAAKMFEQVIALAPDSFAGYSNLGAAYLQQGRYADAIPLLERATNIRRTAETESNLATAYFGLRQFSNAVRIYEDAVQLDDHNYEVWGNLGDAYYWAPGYRDKAPGAYHKAISLALAELAVNPRDANLLGYLAEYHAMLNEREPAKSYLDRALGLAPNDPDLLFSAAIVHNQLGETVQAIYSVQRAIASGYSRTLLRSSPNFDNLHSDSRFIELTREEKESRK
jgi:eukaryotic-like serine/threonine-protein kinase